MFATNWLTYFEMVLGSRRPALAGRAAKAIVSVNRARIVQIAIVDTLIVLFNLFFSSFMLD